MNPLDYLPPDVFMHAWGAPAQGVQGLGSHVCVVGPRYERIAVASVSMEGIAPAPPSPRFEVVRTGHLHTFLPTPHAGSCPLDYTTLFVALYRRRKERITCCHASRPVPLLASGSPRPRRLYEAPPSTAAGGWAMSRTPPSLAAAYASQDTELGILGRYAEHAATSAGHATALSGGSLEGRITMVARTVPESVAATAMPTAALSSPVAAVHDDRQQQQQRLGTTQPHHHHQRRPRPDPQHMQYRVGRSGSTQPLPLPDAHAGTPSSTRSAITAVPTRQMEEAAPQPLARVVPSFPPSPAPFLLSPAIASPATSISTPRDTTPFVSLAISSLRPSVSRESSMDIAESTARPNNTGCDCILMRRNSPSLACTGDTPGAGAMEVVQQSRWLLSQSSRQRSSSGSGDAAVDEVDSRANGEVDTRERLPHQLQRTLERQRQLEVLRLDRDVGVGDTSGPQQRTAEPMFLSHDASDAHRRAREGPRRGQAAAAATVPYVFRGTGTYDDADEIRADSVVVARGFPLAWAQTRSRVSTSPLPQQHDLPLWRRRGQAVRRRRPQLDAAQQVLSDEQQLSPSPAVAAEVDVHSCHTSSAPQRTAAALSSTPASSAVVSRSAAPYAASTSTRTAQTFLSPSICVDPDERSASLHASLSLATSGVIDVNDTMMLLSCALLPSPIRAGHPSRPSLPNAALTDILPSSWVPSEEVCCAERTVCVGDTSDRVSTLAHTPNTMSSLPSAAVDTMHADAVTAVAVSHRAWKRESRCSPCLSASTTGRAAAASQGRDRDHCDFENGASEAHQDGALEEDMPLVRRTSPGTSEGTGKESRRLLSSGSPDVAERQDEISQPSASADEPDDDCVYGHRSCRCPPLPPFSRVASLSSSPSSSPAPLHARTDTKAGGINVDAAFDEADEAGGSPSIPVLAGKTSPMVYLCDMLRLSFSPDNEAEGSRIVDAKLDKACRKPDGADVIAAQREGRVRVGAQDHDNSYLFENAASTSSSPPSQSRTAIRCLVDMDDERIADSNLSASPLSPLGVAHGRRKTAANTITMGSEACTPHRVAGRLALSEDDRRLHASTASTIAWGRVNGGEHSHRDPAARAVTATPVESSTRSSTLFISTPAQTHLQSLLQASMWSTATPCSHEKENSNHNSRSSLHRHPHVVSATSTGRRRSSRATEEDSDDVEDEVKMGAADKNPYDHLATAEATASAPFTMPCDRAKVKCDNGGGRDSPGKHHDSQLLVRQGEQGDDDVYVRGNSNSSSSMTPTRISCVYTSHAATWGSATATVTPSRPAVAAATPAASSPLHSSPFRGSGSFLQVQPGWRGSTSAAATSGANWMSLTHETDIQLLARTTRLTHVRGRSTTEAMTPKVCKLVRSPQQSPHSPPSSPWRRSTGSLSFFLSASATSPGSGDGTRTSGGGGHSEDDEGRGVRAAGSGVYGSAVARRRSWAPRKQQQNHRPRRESRSSMGIHSPSISVRRISRTDSSVSHFSEALAVAPQRLTFGSAIASVSVANSNADSAERWPTGYSTPAVLALPYPHQQRHHRAPPPPYALSSGDGHRRGGSVEKAVESSRYSLLLSSEQRAASPLMLSPFAPRTPSGRGSLPSTGLNQAPLRHGEARNRFRAWSVPSSAIASTAEQQTQHVRRSSCRSPSLSSGRDRGGLHGISGRRYANRALSFSTVRSSPSALATPTVLAGREETLGGATPLVGYIDGPSPSPLNSGRQHRSSSDRSMRRSKESLHIASHGRTRAPTSFMLQIQPAQPRASSKEPQRTLADELRLVTSLAFPTALTEPLMSSSVTAAPLLTTFIASPQRRMGPPTSTVAPPSAPSLGHSPRHRPVLSPELLSLMQMRTSASTTSAAAAESGAMAPRCAFVSSGKPAQRRGCNERVDINVEPEQGSPSSPQQPEPLPPQ